MGGQLKKYLTLGVLVFINALNYMDRFTIAGVLTMLEQNSSLPNCSSANHICCGGLEINDSQGGFLTTSFIVSYMVFSLGFGYFGDRYSRKLLVGIGVLVWSGFTLAGSFANSYGFLLAMRSLVGIGEASYGTIAPTIIADLFPKETRLRALSIFYLATPSGSALGYIVGSTIAHALRCWKWALRVTPGFGFICALLCFFLIEDPARGESDTSGVFKDEIKSLRGELGIRALFRDAWHILRCKSFLWSTLAFSAMTFVIGALAQWGPAYIMWASGVVKGVSDKGESLGFTQQQASLGFGGLAVATGITGVLIGSEWAKRWGKTNPRADALVCAIGSISCAPFIFFLLVFANVYLPTIWIFGVIGETLLMLQWTPVSAILLYVIVPEKRSLAEAIQILFIHLLGDAFSPFIIGSMADKLRGAEHVPDPLSTTVGAMRKEYAALQKSLYMCCFLAVLGAAGFFVCSFYLERDGEAAKRSRHVQVLDDETRSSTA